MGVPDDSDDSDDSQALAPPLSPVSGALASTEASPPYASVAGLSRLGSGPSNRTDEVEIKVVKAPSDWTSGDRCPYYPPRSDGCTEPRSCRDCLNIDVRSDYSCLVNQYGRCVQKNPSTYVQGLDFRCQNASNEAAQSNKQRVQFLADKVDYCHVEDPECQHCRDTVFADVMKGRIDGSLTKFCYGKGGCVCIAVCEASIWKSTIGLTVCNGVVVTSDYDKQYAITYEATSRENGGLSISKMLTGLIGGVAAAVLVIAAVIYIRKRRLSTSSTSGSSHSSDDGSGEANRTGEGSEPTRGPEAPQLNLFGWQSMRSELIEREQLLLAGVEDFSNVRTGYLQLLDVDASAPPPEEDESSAPVLLVPLAGASAPSFSPRTLAMAPSAPSVSPSASPASPTLHEE